MGKWTDLILGERDDNKNSGVNKRELEVTKEETAHVEFDTQKRDTNNAHKPIEARLLNIELRLLELETMLTQASPNTGNKVLSPMARKFRKMRGY